MRKRKGHSAGDHSEGSSFYASQGWAAGLMRDQYYIHKMVNLLWDNNSKILKQVRISPQTWQ